MEEASRAWWRAAECRAPWRRAWPRLSASAPVPQRAPARVKGGRGLMVPAQMSSIHFPASAYGGPLSSATEAGVMQFVGMSRHFHKLPIPQRPRAPTKEDKARAACCCWCFVLSCFFSKGILLLCVCFTRPTDHTLMATGHTVKKQNLKNICDKRQSAGAKWLD